MFGHSLKFSLRSPTILFDYMGVVGVVILCSLSFQILQAQSQQLKPIPVSSCRHWSQAISCLSLNVISFGCHLSISEVFKAQKCLITASGSLQFHLAE